MDIDISGNALFHMKTRVCLKYFVNDCSRYKHASYSSWALWPTYHSLVCWPVTVSRSISSAFMIIRNVFLEWYARECVFILVCFSNQVINNLFLILNQLHSWYFHLSDFFFNFFAFEEAGCSWSFVLES